MAKRDLAAELLRELGQDRTQYHSGEELSARLGVSRTAVPPSTAARRTPPTSWPAACGSRAMPLNRSPGWATALPPCRMV